MPFKYFGPGKKNCHAFTSRADRPTNVLISKITVTEAYNPSSLPANPIKQATCNAIWDTGATASVISHKIVNDLGLQPIRTTKVKNVHDIQDARVFLVNIIMPNYVEVVGVAVTDAKDIGGADVLIGMDIIGRGDFAVSIDKGNTMFSFRIPSIEPIDYTKEINEEKVRYEAHTSPQGQRQERNRKKQAMRKRKK